MKALIRNSCIALAVLGLWGSGPANAHDREDLHNRNHYQADHHNSRFGHYKHHYIAKKHHRGDYREYHRPRRDNIIYIKPYSFYLYGQYRRDRHLDHHQHSKKEHHRRWDREYAYRH